jgi:hypothetical protein
MRGFGLGKKLDISFGDFSLLSLVVWQARQRSVTMLCHDQFREIH